LLGRPRGGRGPSDYREVPGEQLPIQVHSCCGCRADRRRPGFTGRRRTARTISGRGRRGLGRSPRPVSVAAEPSSPTCGRQQLGSHVGPVGNRIAVTVEGHSDFLPPDRSVGVTDPTRSRHGGADVGPVGHRARIAIRQGGPSDAGVQRAKPRVPNYDPPDIPGRTVVVRCPQRRKRWCRRSWRMHRRSCSGACCHAKEPGQAERCDSRNVPSLRFPWAELHGVVPPSVGPVTRAPSACLIWPAGSTVSRRPGDHHT
jgi:hypothetical protein